MKIKAAHITQYSIRIFLMVFWLYVALDKLWNPDAFHRALLRQPFPNWWADCAVLESATGRTGDSTVIRNRLHFFVIQRIRQLAQKSESGKRRSTPQRNPRHSEESSDVGIWGFKGLPFLLSAVLMLAFTMYIALGVAGLYAERPCGCASVPSGLLWTKHLMVNTFLLALSALGYYLSRPAAVAHGQLRYKRSITLFQGFTTLIAVAVHHTIIVIRRRFPRRFAPFPGRPVGI